MKRSDLVLAVGQFLIENKGATTADIVDAGIKVNAVVMSGLKSEGIIQAVGSVKHTDDEGKARRGRPRAQWALTPNARKRVKRALAASAA